MTAAPWAVSVLMRGGATRASVVLARRGDEVAVFDTGMAHHADALVAALAGQNIRPHDVTLVFNTHTHVDHSHNNVLFERARVYCSVRDREWTRAVHAALAAAAQPSLEDIAPYYPDVAVESYDAKIVRKVLGIEKMLWEPARIGTRDVALEEHTPPPGITVVKTPGHSPFHVSFVIETVSDPVLVCGDALLLRDEADYPAPRMPVWSERQYRESRDWIDAFDGVIVPGHDQPFHHLREPQNKTSKPPAK